MTPPKKIFLFGVGRSGTTLLQSMLHAHSQVSMLPENHLIHNYLLAELGGKQPQFDHRFLHSETASRLKEIVDVKRVLEAPTTHHAFELICSEVAQKEQVAFVGDKDPEHINYLPHLQRVFPDAFFLHIIRDPRDVILSRKRSQWGAKYPWQWHITEYKHQFEKAITFGFQNHQFFSVYYEELVDSPQQVLESICGFLGVSFDEQMLQFSEGASSLVSENEKNWKENVSKPVLKGNYGKWKKQLPQSEVKQIESVLWDSPVFKHYTKKSKEKPSLSLTNRAFYFALQRYILRKDLKKYKL